MEKYTNAELEIVALTSADTISSSIEIILGENELPLDKYLQV